MNKKSMMGELLPTKDRNTWFLQESICKLIFKRQHWKILFYAHRAKVYTYFNLLFHSEIYNI